MSAQGPNVVVPSAMANCDYGWFWCHYMESDLSAQFFFAFGVMSNIMCMVLFLALAFLYWCNVKGKCVCRREKKKSDDGVKKQSAVSKLQQGTKYLTSNLIDYLNDVNLHKNKSADGKPGLLQIKGYQKLDDKEEPVAPSQIVVEPTAPPPAV